MHDYGGEILTVWFGNFFFFSKPVSVSYALVRSIYIWEASGFPTFLSGCHLSDNLRYAFLISSTSAPEPSPKTSYGSQIVFWKVYVLKGLNREKKKIVSDCLNVRTSVAFLSVAFSFNIVIKRYHSKRYSINLTMPHKQSLPSTTYVTSNWVHFRLLFFYSNNLPRMEQGFLIQLHWSLLMRWVQESCKGGSIRD